MTKSTITRERLQELAEGQSGFNLRTATHEESQELARMALAAMDSEPVEMPLDYLQGHKDGLEWAAQLAEANHPETGDWLYDDPIELAKAIRKGPDMPPAQPAADSEPVAWTSEEAIAEVYCDETGMIGPKHMLGDVPLYRHAQQPVVGYVPLGDSPYDIPYSMPSNLREFIDQEIGILFSDDDAQGMWIACRRAAMLQGGNSPVIPDTWISVSERLPEEGGRYWCYVEEQTDLGKSHYQWNCSWNGERWWVEGEDGGIVTHWMPLPAAPQELK